MSQYTVMEGQNWFGGTSDYRRNSNRLDMEAHRNAQLNSILAGQPDGVDKSQQPQFNETVTSTTLNDYSTECAVANARWDHDPATGAQLAMNIGEKLMLVVSELSEAMEGHRKSLMDDKIPHRSMFEVELADALIRIFHMAGYLKLDLEGAYRDKLQYNQSRLDHTNAARLAEGGKKY